MPSRRKSKKRPCRICRKWFLPNPRVGDRQMTCGAEKCMRKWRIKKCAEWYKKNRSSYFQTNYLSTKLASLAVDEKKDPKQSAAITTPLPRLPTAGTGKFPQLPRSLIQEVIGGQHLVIIEYVAQLLFRSVQEVIKQQPLEITSDSPQVVPVYRSRGDSASRVP